MFSVVRMYFFTSSGTLEEPGRPSSLSLRSGALSSMTEVPDPVRSGRDARREVHVIGLCRSLTSPRVVFARRRCFRTFKWDLFPPLCLPNPCKMQKLTYNSVILFPHQFLVESYGTYFISHVRSTEISEPGIDCDPTVIILP